MSTNVFIFLPKSLNLKQTGYLEGIYRQFEECEAYYVTGVSLTPLKAGKCIGYLNLSRERPQLKVPPILFDNKLNKVARLNCDSHKCIVRILYDLEMFKRSDMLTSCDEYYGEHFDYLSTILKRQQKRINNGRQTIYTWLSLSLIYCLDMLIRLCAFVKPVVNSAILNHFHENLMTAKWVLLELNKEKSCSPKIGNLLVTKLLDLLLGFVLLQYFIQHEKFILHSMGSTRDTVIHNLKELLTYLMGSPIGLKLNRAMNNFLGTFFFYNISLWMTFLDIMQPIIEKYFNHFLLLGRFGLSFQTAILADLISIATFHLYCIYIYASRLIYIQLKGLLSLWRLFIGRKYNPLRERVDSCQYSQQELFVGTLGFTVLLFLVPTTTMYYTVFTIFRLAIVIIDRLMEKLRFSLHCLPVYVSILWIFNSSEVAGTLRLNWQESTEDGLIMEAKLDSLPLYKCVNKFSVKHSVPADTLPWNKVFHRILTGTLI